MWKKPELNKTEFEKMDLVELSEKEAMALGGGIKWGLCVLAGYACDTKSYTGGGRPGICLTVGI